MGYISLSNSFFYLRNCLQHFFLGNVLKDLSRTNSSVQKQSVVRNFLEYLNPDLNYDPFNLLDLLALSM